MEVMEQRTLESLNNGTISGHCIDHREQETVKIKHLEHRTWHSWRMRHDTVHTVHGSWSHKT
jgi:hypothetical protein